MTSERGRPRGFDMNAALDHALEVFWSQGFQGASLSELTAAMGVSKPSLYAAFGNKEALYLQALERYALLQSAPHLAILDTEPDGRSAVEGYLRSIATMLTDPALPGGCFIINGVADRGGLSTPAAVELALQKALQGSENKLRGRLLRARRDGHLVSGIHVGALAGFFVSLIAGMGVLAKSGAKRAKLYVVIAVAMDAWPALHASNVGQTKADNAKWPRKV